MLTSAVGKRTKKKKIACLGLSANPPHVGHVETAQIVLRSKAADEVWFIPCFAHPFDKELASVKHRLQMAKLLETKRVKASDIEIARRGKSYTVDTVRGLRAKYSDHEFLWIIGSDIVKTKSYLKWKDWEKLSQSIKFLVVIRPGFEIEELPPGFTLVGGATKSISSTKIRERLRQGLSIDDLVPRKIKEYIEEYNIYKE